MVCGGGGGVWWWCVVVVVVCGGGVWWWWCVCVCGGGDVCVCTVIPDDHPWDHKVGRGEILVTSIHRLFIHLNKQVSGDTIHYRSCDCSQ